MLYITARLRRGMHLKDNAYTRRSAARVCALLRCFMRRSCCCSHTSVFTASGTSPVGAAPACASKACPCCRMLVGGCPMVELVGKQSSSVLNFSSWSVVVRLLLLGQDPRIFI